MSMSAFSFGRLSSSLQVVCVALLFSLSASAQVTQTLGSLDVDRLGAAVYTLPISAPNGVGGVKPNITALYNSQAANGLLGKGGSIGGLSVIKRCSQSLVRDGINKAISWTAEDRFCIDSQRLMLVAGTQGVADSQYKTEIDNGVVYTAKGGTAGNPDYFEARAEDGATLIFGGAATSKEQGAATMSWALSQYKDAANNAIEYTYEGTAADGLRIKRINYAFAIPNTTTDPGAYIEFVYRDRDDPISKYVAGYEFRTNKLLTQINSYSLLGLLHRSYQFDLATSSGLAGYVTRLQSVKECTSQSNCFDITQFEWGRTQKNVTTNQIETKNIKVDFLGKIYGVSQSAEFSFEAPQAADLNGNGIAEFLWVDVDRGSSTFYYMASLDAASLSSDSPKNALGIPYTVPTTGSPLEHNFADINADGFLDLISPASNLDNFSRRLWRIGTIERTAHTWYFPNGAGKQLTTSRYNFVRSLDLDGDGYQEVLGINHRSLNFGLHKFNRLAPQNLSNADYRGRTYFEDVFLRLTGVAKENGVFIEYRDDLLASGDFNNDGNKDLILLVKYGDPAIDKQTAQLNWYELKGSELILKKTIYEESRSPLETTIDSGGEYRLLRFESFGSLRVVDINGDGLDDIAFKKYADWMYSINTGNGFLPFITIAKNPGAHPVINPTFIDVNNDGSTDYIYGETTPTLTKPTIYVRYWNSKIGTFDGPVLIRTTPDKPILFADMNGDGFADIVENHVEYTNRNNDATNVYGFTNSVGNAAAGFQGVLDQDAIVSVKAGSIVNTSIDYQTLIRPKNINVLSCTSGVSGINPCYDFASTSHYKPLKIDVPHIGNSLDAPTPSFVVNSAPYYTKTNEPFLGLNNPHVGAAKVAQYVAPFPIVTRVKSNLATSNDKKYYYEVMRTQSGGRGLLGFEKTSVEDVATGVRTETFWRQDWPFTGLPTSKVVWNKFNKAMSEVENTLAVNPIDQSKAFKVNISKVIEKRYETGVNDDVQGGLIGVNNNASSSQSSSSTSAGYASEPAILELLTPGERSIKYVAAGVSVGLKAVALSKDGALWKDSSGNAPVVKFYADDYTYLGEARADGTPFNWMPLASKTYSIKAKVFLDAGVVLQSRTAGVVVADANGYPVVEFLDTIRNGVKYSTGELIHLVANATDKDGSIVNVKFYANNALVGTGNSIGSNNYRFDWTPASVGVYNIKAIATDSANNKSESKTLEIFYGVNGSSSSSAASSAAAASLTLPLTYPLTNSVLGENLQLGSSLKNSAAQQLYEPDGSVPVVRFYANGLYVGESRADGYWFQWKPVAAGVYDVVAVAMFNNEQVVSRTATLIVKGSATANIELTAPKYYGARYEAGSYVGISANINDSSFNIAKVIFYANDQELSADTTAPYSYAWMPSSNGIYTVKAVAVDVNGNAFASLSRVISYGAVTSNASSSSTYSIPSSSQSSSLSSVRDPVRFELTSPLERTTDEYGLGAEVILGAPVIGADGGTWVDAAGNTAQVDFYANEQLLTGLRKVPNGYHTYWKPSATGTYNIKAVARISESRTITTGYGSVRVISANAPNVSLVHPVTDRFLKLGDSLNLVANASDTDGNLLSVNFYANGERLSAAVQGSNPFNQLWTPYVTGEYLIRAEAMDKTYVKSTSGVIRVSVVNPGLKPAVTLINSNSASVPFGSNLTLSADAIDYDGTISKVEFYANDQLVGTATTKPYQINFKLQSAGSYLLKAIAYDNLNNTGVSTISQIQHGLVPPSLGIIDPDDDCFYAINFNAPKDVAFNLVYELYEREVGGAWSTSPVAQQSLWQGNLPPFKKYFHDHPQGKFEYRSRVCPANNYAACSQYSNTLPVYMYENCKSIALPTVKLIRPPANLEVGKPAVINAEAQITGNAIYNVRFFYGDKLIGVDNTAPYSVAWTPTETGRDYLYAQAEGFNEGTAVSDMHVLNIISLGSSSSSSTAQVFNSFSSSSVNGGGGNQLPGSAGGGNTSVQSSSSVAEVVAILSSTLTNGYVNSLPPIDEPTTVVGSVSGQFRVSESGAATYSVPLELPEGVAGVAPQLSFDYSSMSGNGLLGQGWSLSGLSAITRCRQTLVQDNQSLPIRWSGDDRFCFDGQRLMLVSGVYGAPDSEYRTEIDSGAYATARGGSIGHPDYFEVRAKDGSISYFGFTNDSKLTGATANTTLTWSINRFQDNVGNGIDFIYNTTSANGQYIEEIRYAFPSINAEQPSASRTDFNAKVRFNYVDRKDKTEAFIAGQKFIQTKKLDSVSIFNTDSSAGFAVQKLVKHYRLKYMGDATVDARYENTLTRLTQIFECRAETENVTDGSCLAPLSFTWGGGSHIAFDKTMTSLAFPTVEEGRYLLNHQFADVNGDGKQDLIYLTIEKLVDQTTADVNINIAHADSNENGLNKQATINLYRQSYEKLRITALDYNADGRQDLALYTGEYWRIYLSTVNANSGWYLGHGGDVENLQEFTDPDMLFMDVNGDGLADAVTSAGYYRLQRNTNAVGSSRAYSFADQINSFQWQPRSEFAQVNEPLPTQATNFSNCYETSVETKIQQEAGADFNGDGVMDFLGSYVRKLSCSTSAGPASIDATYRYALVNLGGVLQVYSGAALQTPSILPGGSTDRLFTVDVNGDGLTDIVSLGYDKKLFVRTSNGFGFNTAQEWVELAGLVSGAVPQFMDYNSDGIVDVLWRNKNQGTMMLKFGGLSSLPQAIFNTSVGEKESYLLMDVSGDGVVDYVHVDSDSLSGRLGQMAVKGQPACYIQYHQGGSTEVCPDPSYALMEDQQHNFIYKIESGFGNSTLIAYGTLSNSGRYATMDVKPELVSTIVSNNCPSNVPGYCSPTRTDFVVDRSAFYSRLNSGWELPAGHRVFDPKTESFVNASGLQSKGNPVLEVNGAMQVVTSVKSSAPLPNDINAMSRIDYYYAEAKLQAMGRGFLGFSRLKTVDAQTGVATVTTYRQDFPFSGSPLTTTVYKDDSAGSPILSYAVNHWDSRLLKHQGTRVFQPYLKQSQEFTYVLESDGNVSASPLQKITTDTAMYPFDSDTADSLGNVREVIVTTEGSGKTLIKKTTNQYSSDNWALRMGRLKRSEVETIFGGETNRRIAEFKYYGIDDESTVGGAKGLLKEEMVVTDSINDQLVTEYSYDSRGNKAKVTVSGRSGDLSPEPQKRTTTHRYDDLGRYLVSTENGAKHLSMVNKYDQYGQPGQITDANNISIEVKYDSFGNEYLRKEVFAGGQTGAWTRKDTRYCDSGSVCPVGAKFFTHQRVSGGGETIEYFDMLGRNIRAGKKGFDGTWIYTDSEYDSLGRIKRQSMPYFSNSSPVGWTENFYDSLGRVTRIEAPDESGTIKTETAYSWDSTIGALITTIKNPKGQVRKEYRNGLGQLIQVEDQLKGTIVYEYSPLGEILSVTTDAPDVNESTIKMCYDKLGRKSGMFDPDKGGFNGAPANCSQVNNWNGGVTNTVAGWWHYRYNAFGELVEQRDPSGQSTRMAYDLLGRMVNRWDYKSGLQLEANTAWFFDKPLGASDEQDKTRGKLTAVVMSNSASTISNNDSACTGVNHCSIYTYNGRAQISSTTTRLQNGDVFITQSDYDSIGRLYQVRDVLDSVGGIFGFDSGVQTHFNENGYAYRSVDIASWDGTDGVLSTITSMNQNGQVTREIRGNGLTTVNDYYPKSGLLKSQRVTDAVGLKVVQSIDYQWDSLGNLTSRTNKSARVLKEGQTLQANNRAEGFCYDALNRLVKSLATSNPVCSGEASAGDDITYDGFGNIKNKKGVGNYIYNRVDGGPHAVTKAGTSNYVYDSNGNMVEETIAEEPGGKSDLGRRKFKYTSYDMVETIERGNNRSVEFKYGPDRSRWQRKDRNGTILTTTTYLGNVERIEKAGVSEVEWKRNVAGVVITYKTTSDTDQNNLKIHNADKSYLYTDHLGSVDIITNTLGVATQSMSFDPWGARRPADSNNLAAWGEGTTQTDSQVLGEILASLTLTGFANPITTRGYTGHEMIDDMGIIHMNGRIYDPRLARFLQADPFIQAATNTQSYNRYSYVLNNPLNATDPSGFFSFNPFRKITRGLIRFAVKVFGAEVVNIVGSIIATYYGGPLGAALWAYDFGRAMGASSGMAFKSAAAAYITAMIPGGTGVKGFLVRGIVGGISSELTGGKFGHGFISAGIGGMVGNTGNWYGNLALKMVVSGTVSEMTGGKFANGARSAAISYVAQSGFEKMMAGGKQPEPEQKSSGSKTSCNPINIATGEKYLTMVDYQAEGASQLTFERHYSSYATEKTALGIGWRSNFDRKLEVNYVGDVALRVVAVRHQGDAIVFNWVGDNSEQGGRWVTDSARYETIRKTESGWELLFTDNSREIYDAEGRLIAIKQLDGYEQTLAYGDQGTVKNVLLSVSDNFGQQLQFGYDLQARMTSMTATDGSVTRYEYDQLHNLTKVISPDETVDAYDNTYVVYDYENSQFKHAITGIRNSQGQRIHSMAYDEQGRAILSALGGDAERVDMVFSEAENNTHKTLVKNSLGKRTTYTFDQYNKPLLVEGHPTASCIGSNQNYDYDDKGLLRSKTDWNGSVTSYEYNDRGLETLRVEAAGTENERSVSTEWHTQWRLPEAITKDGLVVTFKYNDQAQVTQRIERDTTTELTFVNKLFKRYPERVWSYDYNAQGLLTTVDGPRTDVADITHFEYDTTGNQKAVINAVGHRSEVLEVNERGLPKRVSDANGVITELDYNARGWLTHKIVKSDKGDSTTVYHYSGISDYNNQGLVSAVTLPNGEEITYEYDAARRLTAQYNKAGERIEYALDLEGNRTEQHIFNATGTLAFSHKQVFDELGRLLSSIGADGNAIGFGYDKAGNRESTTDARGNTTRYAYDALNRLQATTDALDGVVSQTYDATDRITSVTDQRNLMTQYRYNGFGNKITQISPDTGETLYGYDAVGNMVSKRDARGVVTEYRYDAIGRVTDVIYPAANEDNIHYRYDDQQSTNAIGRISKVNDATGEQSYSYNAFGQVTQLQSSIQGVRYAQAYNYDRSSQLVMQQYPSGRRVNYHYDAQGRLATVDTEYHKQQQNLLTHIKHYPFGPLAALGYGNGAQLNVGVDQDYRIRTQQVLNAANNAFFDRAYDYDNGSNIVGIIDYTKPSANQIFGYDELSRLTDASGSYGVISYEYDAVGNRKSREQNNRLEAYEYAENSNRLLNVITEGERGELHTRALGYDAVGNIVNDSASAATKALTFGHNNRLEQVQVSGNATAVAGYEYNAKGQRVIKQVDGKVIHFHYDIDNRLLAETTETGAPIREYIYAANQRIAMVDYQRNTAGDIYFIINDHLGTPQRLLDAQQQVVWSVDQSPFGEVTVEGNIEQPLRFPGQYADAETGYSYNYFRDYDPTLGRYIESDPIGLEAGVNTFGYVRANPVIRIDPLGLMDLAGNGMMCYANNMRNDVLRSEAQQKADLALQRAGMKDITIFGEASYGPYSVNYSLNSEDGYGNEYSLTMGEGFNANAGIAYKLSETGPVIPDSIKRVGVFTVSANVAMFGLSRETNFWSVKGVNYNNQSWSVTWKFKAEPPGINFNAGSKSN